MTDAEFQSNSGVNLDVEIIEPDVTEEAVEGNSLMFIIVGVVVVVVFVAIIGLVIKNKKGKESPKTTEGGNH